MRVLLATSASYSPTRGGANRVNRVWLERLVSHGHVCQVATTRPSTTVDSVTAQCKTSALLIHTPEWEDDYRENESSNLNGVGIETASLYRSIASDMTDIITRFKPDWVLVSSEDLGQARLKAALSLMPDRTVYLAHTPQLLPFGSESLYPSQVGELAISQTAAIVVISQYMHQYCTSRVSVPTIIAHPLLYKYTASTQRTATNDAYVTMINPCAVKGISVFLGIAAQLKHLHFAALPGWGTTQTDIESLVAAGVHLMAPCRDISQVLAQTQVLVVPSLWKEGFGLVVVEALLSGVPVVASDLGGLKEAKLDTDYTIHTVAIHKYTSLRDEHLLPVPEIPEQHLGPWIDAVDTLTSNVNTYRRASEKASEAAESFVSGLDPDILEHFLMTQSAH